MNTEVRPFHTPLGKISTQDYSTIEYRVGKNTLWVAKNGVKKPIEWCSQTIAIEERQLTQREIELFENEMHRQMSIRKELIQFLLSINKPLTNIHSVNFPKNKAVEIFQHEYGITTAQSQMHVLGSIRKPFSLFLALYDIKNKVAALAQIDAKTHIESLTNIIRHLSITSTIAHLYGGLVNSLDTCLEVLEFLRKNKIRIENCALIKYSNGDASLAIDAKDGKLYSPIVQKDLIPSGNIEDKESVLLSLITSGCTPLLEGYNGLADLASGL